jgi:hypothetical protein
MLILKNSFKKLLCKNHASKLFIKNKNFIFGAFSKFLEILQEYLNEPKKIS